jgi:hypothetical protein
VEQADEHARLEAENDRLLAMYNEACAEEQRLSRRLADCEEALGDARASEEAFRKEMLIPFNEREGRTPKAVQSLSWEELLGVSSRNLLAALDAEQRLTALREAAQAVARADSMLYRGARDEDWERYTRAIVGLRAALNPGAEG